MKELISNKTRREEMDTKSANQQQCIYLDVLLSFIASWYAAMSNSSLRPIGNHPLLQEKPRGTSIGM